MTTMAAPSVLSVRTELALLAACRAEPGLVALVPLDAFSDAARLVLSGDDTNEELADLIDWLDTAPAALADEGVALLLARAHPRRPEPMHIEPRGALRLWREELARGMRTCGTVDALWRAACAEAMALDAARAGDAKGARAALARATAILAAARDAQAA